MNPGTRQTAWRQLDNLFHALLNLDRRDRAEFLDEACRDNPELRQQAESLLHAIPETDGFLRKPIGDAAKAVKISSVVEGQRFGAHKVLRRIGEGGMGTVYLASRADDLYEQRVAIKLARAPFAGDPGMLSRFRTEQQILATLDHPNIGRLLDGGVTSVGVPFLVMEFVEGVPIDEFCQQRQLDTAARLKLFSSVCAAVDYAHRHLVVHRDIKPANILVNAEGIPKLLDFGVAKLLDHESAMHAQTETVDRMMTPDFASPEQLRCEPVTTATDVYALGVLLYKLLTGCLPLEVAQASPLEAAKVICERVPLHPSEVVRRDREASKFDGAEDAHRTLRGDLDNIVLTALEKEPSQRYSSVAAFAGDVDAYCSGYPVKARTTSWGYRIAKFVRRNAWAVSAAAIMLIAFIGFTVAMTLERNRANRDAETSRVVTEFMTDIFKTTNPSVSHGNTVTARELLDKASAGIQGLSKDPLVQARLMRAMGSSYMSLGLYAQSVAPLEKAVALQTRLFGDDDPETLHSTSVLGGAYAAVDRYRDAEKLLRRALSGQQRRVGADSEATIATVRYLADTLTREGRYGEAESLLRRALASQIKTLGSESREVLLSRNRLVNNLRWQGRLAEAEKMGRESLAIDQRVLGSYDWVSLSSIEELAFIVTNEGRPDEAERLDREGYRIATQMYGPENQDTLLELGDIGDALQEQGRLTEAEPIQREAVERLRIAEGPKARHTIEMTTTLVITLSMEKKYAEAESLCREALDASLQGFGPDSVLAIDATANLALVLAHEGRPGESQALFKNAVAASFKAEGTLAADVLYAHGEGLAVMGRTNEALGSLEQAIARGFSNKQEMTSDDDLKTLRVDPRYKAMITTIK